MSYYHQNERDEAVSIGCFVLLLIFIFAIALVFLSVGTWLAS